MISTDPENAMSRIEVLIKDCFCSEKSSYGTIHYCVYYGIGTVERGCPKTCAYALERVEVEKEMRTRSVGE